MKHDPNGPTAPRRVFREITGDESAGTRADGTQRRKHGRQLASGEELARWAQREGRIFPGRHAAELITAADASGGEHLVSFAETTGRVVKLTKPGLFGAQADDAGAYVQRWALHNAAFDDDVQIEGIVTLESEDAPRVVISQPFIAGRDATDAETAGYLTEKGFHEHEGRWVHPIRELAVWDTITPGNVITAADGSVHVIDLQIGPASREELAAVRQKTGLGKPPS